MSRALAKVAWSLALVGAVSAQETLDVGAPEPGTIRLGDAARVAVRVEGKTAAPRAPQVPAVDGLDVRVLGPSRNSYTFYDGRRLVEQVGVQYVLELRPTRAGVFEVPPFPIWTGTREQRTPLLRLEAKQDLVGAELGYLDVEVSPRRVYVHEPVRVHLDYGVLAGQRLADAVYDRYRYQDIEVQAAWLDAFPGGERIETPEPTGDSRVAVCNQRLVRAEFEAGHARGDKQWQRYSFDRAFLPTRLGKVTLSAPMLRFRCVTSSGRADRFGRRVGQTTENYYVYGQPVELEVLPIPEEGRPTPYFGAVGRFAVDAVIDRAQVRVGESVKLRFTVRGSGNFEFLRLPELAEVEGFHKLGANEAERGADKVVITYDLTPLSTDVVEVPAIRWNYFDTTPGVEDFVEVAIDVQPLPAGEALLALPEEVSAVTPGVDDVFDLPAFDGAPTRRATVSWWWGIACAVAPWLLALSLSYFVRARRRAAADVSGLRARGAKRGFEAALARGDDALDALAVYLSDRMDVAAAAVIAPDLERRLCDAGLEAGAARAAAELVERGTAARYGGGAPLQDADARALVARIEGLGFATRGLSSLVLLPLALACGGSLSAQQAPEDAVRAYRTGDYAAADAGFAAAFDATGDRRLLRARGNCLFRMGEFARARWAYERARLGAPRDEELLANLRLVRRKLELPPDPQGLSAGLRRQLDRWSASERAGMCGLAMLLAAGCLVLGWRRVGLRWAGLVCLAPGLVLAVDVLWLSPSRPATAVALEDLAITSEPRVDMPAVAAVRAGVLVTLTGGASGGFVRVEAGDRRGYAPRAAVGVVE